MTKMVPETIHSSVRSGAERRLFQSIREARRSDGWFCLHSLGLAHHASKRRAEVDFLLITPDGLFALEAKGGRIRREGAVWVFTDRWGTDHRKRESPFDQAATCMFAIERHLREKFPDRPRLTNVMLGYGVLMPDIAFNALGIEADARQVYDRARTSQPFDVYVRDLVEFTRSIQPRARNGLNAAEVATLVEHLRGDFDLVPGFDVRAADVNAGLKALTRNQYECLTRADERPRLLVEGTAGTGKSLLAVEIARREARAGRRVLLLCFNVLLAAKLRASLGESVVEHSISVCHLHGYTRELIARAKLDDDFEAARSVASNADDVYRHLHPYYAELALAEIPGERFDTLVVDEAQDVLTDDVLNLFDACLRNGLEGGRWRIFLDRNEQAAVYGTMDAAALARLERFGVTHFLSMNCRNTKQIENAMRAIARPREATAAWQVGDSVDLRWYRDEADLGRGLNALLGEMHAQSIEPARVTLVFPRVPSEEMQASMRRASLRELKASDIAYGAARHTFWTTASAFKGLENDVVVVVGVEKLDSDWWRAVTYVGMTRARVRLYLLLHESMRPAVDERFAEMLRDALKEVEVG